MDEPRLQHDVRARHFGVSHCPRFYLRFLRRLLRARSLCLHRHGLRLDLREGGRAVRRPCCERSEQRAHIRGRDRAPLRRRWRGQRAGRTL